MSSKQANDPDLDERLTFTIASVEVSEDSQGLVEVKDLFKFGEGSGTINSANHLINQYFLRLAVCGKI